MKKLERRDYFSTMIFQGELDGQENINADTLSSINAVRRNTEATGTADEERSGNWRSAKNLHRNPDFEPLKTQIQAALELMSEELRYSTQHFLKITSMWANVIPPGHGARAECRPGSLWTGCYCVQVPAGTGSMKFIDPRTINIMSPPKYEKTNRLRASLTKVDFKPRKGHLVVFPAWLYSEVEPNLSQDKGRSGDYVYISFAVSQQKK